MQEHAHAAGQGFDKFSPEAESQGEEHAGRGQHAHHLDGFVHGVPDLDVQKSRDNTKGRGTGDRVAEHKDFESGEEALCRRSFRLFATALPVPGPESNGCQHAVDVGGHEAQTGHGKSLTVAGHEAHDHGKPNEGRVGKSHGNTRDDAGAERATAQAVDREEDHEENELGCDLHKPPAALGQLFHGNLAHGVKKQAGHGHIDHKDAKHLPLFFIILPIMAGGVGEGAIPLSIGYATLLHMDQGVALGRVLPMVMLGGLTAIIISGCLNQLGKRYPHLTGEGQLMPNRANADATVSQPAFSGKADVTTIASGALLAVLLYMLGMLGHKLIGLPAPVGMLFMAVLVKLCNGASPRLLEGSQVVYKFFQTSVTYPILFAVGVAITPWHELVAAFTVSNLLVIISTVSALVATGFFVGKKIGMHPIDVAIVSCCQSGQGGTGDVAILTAGNRMSLMPFAQIATRIGGAINVSVSLLILGNFLV